MNSHNISDPFDQLNNLNVQLQRLISLLLPFEQNFLPVQLLYIENSNVPVIVDAGIGTPSEAAQAMEIGADGVLLNTAVAQAKDSAQMARAMKLSVEAGRLGYLAGRMDKKYYASSSSPLEHISKLS